MSESKKEIFSFVPQELRRHFIVATTDDNGDQQQLNNSIRLKKNQFDCNFTLQSFSSEEPDDTFAQFQLSDTCSSEEDNIFQSRADEADDEDEGEDDDNDDEDYDDDSSTIFEKDELEHEEYNTDLSHSPKWSFVRTLFSKLSLRTHPNQQVAVTPTATTSQDHDGHNSYFLSHYGTLQPYGKIGEGVSATVQLIAKQHEIFAVKIFRRKKKREAVVGYMKALAGEFCISSALNHPNIIKTIDFVRLDEDHERYCIVMEYCQEGDMYSLIKQGKLQDIQIYSYFKQLILGLDYLHSLGVAHRDLKPENLLIQQGVLKIADFGSADVFRVAWQDHSRLSDGLCGTTPYMAPEIFLDQGYWAAPVDVWAAGVILFCMKFDGVPFGSAQNHDANYPIYLQKRPLRQYDPFNKLMHESRTLIYAMLNPDCNRRITIQAVLKMPWMQSISSESSNSLQ